MITVIDYGAGNLRSVENALKHLQAPYRITSQAADVSSASAILLPGVGHFGQMMRSLELLGLIPVLRQMLRKGVPYLGICLGMHALFERSEEAPTLPGLGILRGAIQRFPAGMKVPHMGWNQLRIAPSSRLFRGVSADPFVYFAHSYYLPAGQNASEAVALADYGGQFVAAVETDTIYGTQFHPEKSSEIGLRILANFAELDPFPNCCITTPGGIC
ncbi:MAG: imidazole glycerol phosphate synthase, glutamine amidotransferase subunit [Acidobacteria bacterium RIFCSPLOWO2_02_FULL_59_13]|nr:MAG: imidazole glycerol phosphate synthase, glutamine amidotransferase subunit [Acidobacteria bacterium RIFCSPLOWO2_02_FULL_59_13]